ncbi:MAG: hypothetical protein NT014_05320 [Candidatus Omnitrophica bacterium]|nr:hypothetical protein [Candidatus Omnitrophota bacterium]
MKKCSYCFQVIPEDATECNHCKETLINDSSAKPGVLGNREADKEIIEELEMMRRLLVSPQ